MYRRKIIILGGNGFIGTKLSNFYSKKKINTVSIGRSSRSKNIYSVDTYCSYSHVYLWTNRPQVYVIYFLFLNTYALAVFFFRF